MISWGPAPRWLSYGGVEKTRSLPSLPKDTAVGDSMSSSSQAIKAPFRIFAASLASTAGSYLYSSASLSLAKINASLMTAEYFPKSRYVERYEPFLRKWLG